MAQQQQQQRRDEFANQDRNRDRNDDAGKNDQFGTGGATDPAVTQYTYYETTMATGYGAPPPVTGVPAGAYVMPNYGTYDPTVYGTTGAAGFGTGTGGGGQWGQGDTTAGGGGGQWGQGDTAGGGGDGQRGQDANTGDGGGNKGRDQK